MKRLLCLLLLLSLAVWAAGCGKQPEPVAPSSENAASGEVPAAASSTAPTETQIAPAQPEDLLAWGGKTLSGYGAKWAEREFADISLNTVDEEDADCASCSFAFSDSEKNPGMTVNGSLYLGKDASVLFDIPEEAELDPLTDGFLAEQVKALLPEAKEEPRTSGSTVWNVRSFCQEAQTDGYLVYDLIAWSEADGALAYVNASAVLRGAALGDKAAETVSALMQEWFSSLEIR